MYTRAALALVAVLRASSARADDFPSPAEAYEHETMGRFDEAATALEAHTDATPTGRAWMERAVAYRIALGDVASAMRDLRALAQEGGEAERVAALELDAAVVFAREGRWREGRRFHEDWLRRHARDASPTLRVRALVELGDAYAATGDAVRARVAYRAATTTGPRPTGEVTESDMPLRERFARAELALAEPSYRAFMARALPPNRGTTARAYSLWMERTVTPFIAETVRLQRALVPTYVAIANLGVPRLALMARGRVLGLYRRLGEYRREVPTLPPDIASNPALVDAYCSSICWMHENHYCGRPDTRILENIAGLARGCLRDAASLREPAPECETELVAIGLREFPADDEIIPIPNQGLAHAGDRR